METNNKSVLRLFDDIVEEFEKTWPRNSLYPFLKRKSNSSIQELKSSKSWFYRKIITVTPLYAEYHLEGMRPFMNYLKGYTLSELEGLSKIAEINLEGHSLFSIHRPLVKLATAVGGLSAFIISMANFKLLSIPTYKMNVLEPFLWGAIIGVTFGIVYMFLAGPIGARAKILRELLVISVVEKKIELSNNEDNQT